MPRYVPRVINRIVRRYTTRSHGYVRVRLDTGRVMLEHRALMENHLGRKLRRDEHVHHVDKDTFNNALGNLRVFSPSKHREVHAVLTRNELTCAKCGKVFLRAGAAVRSKRGQGQTRFFCSRLCVERSTGGWNKKICHGTRNTYVRHGCRCPSCTTAVREYQRQFR